MIIDKIKNSSLYFNLGKKITKALKFLAESDFSQMESGRYEIDGSNIFAIVNIYETKLEKEGSWEAHRQYIDIHFMVEGSEAMGYANLDKMKTSQGYDPNKDSISLEGNGDLFILEPGIFAIFYPTDAHMPGVLIDGPQLVKKIVVKVKID